MKKVKLLIIIFSFLSFLFFNFALAFTSQDKQVIDQLILNQSNLNQKFNNFEKENNLYDVSTQKLIQSIEIKNETITEKERAYNEAINQSKILISFFGVLSLILLIAFGFWHKGELNNKKDELERLFKDRIEVAREQTRVDVDKAVLEIKTKNRDDLLETEGKIKSDFSKYAQDIINKVDPVYSKIGSLEANKGSDSSGEPSF